MHDLFAGYGEKQCGMKKMLLKETTLKDQGKRIQRLVGEKNRKEKKNMEKSNGGSEY